jgi:photosystem II stability/assembly factor-like uncharacterized protein
MKKLITVLLIVFVAFMSFDLSAQTGSIWQWQHPSPQGNTLRYVKYWDANNWYAIGYSGTFMKTTNAGATWTFNHLAGVNFGPSGQKTFMYDAHFFNQTTGIVVGSGSATAPEYHFGIVRTTNGGTTFDTVASTPFTTGTFYQVFFLNSTVGYAVGTGTPKLYKTTNAGASWDGVTAAPTVTLYDVYAWSESNLIVSAATNVYKSTDGGTTWSAAISTGASATLYKIDFIDANTGFVTGSSTAFRYTTNAGLNWTTPTNTGLTTSTFYDMKAKSSSVVLPQKLNEGFENTTFPPSGWTSKNIAGTSVWSRSTAQFHTGTASAYINYESTGGDDWLVTPKINGIAATDSLKFWWKNQFSSAYPPDSLVIRVSTTDTAVASFTGVIARINSATAPFTWTEFKYSLSAYAGQNIHIAFHHFNTDGNGGYLDDVTVGPPAGPGTVTAVYLTGNSFSIHKTTNFGTSWDTIGFLTPTQPWTSTYYSTDFSSTGDTLITAGAFGLINRRIQSNQSRSVYTSFLKAGIVYDVWAASSTGNVISVGASSSAGAIYDQIFRSTNGGTTWAYVPFSTTYTGLFYCIDMIDNNTGYVCGTNSGVYRTTNGGSNWDSVAIDVLAGPTMTFRKVDFINATTGWLFASSYVGGTDSSTIYKTTNGGTNWTKQFMPINGSGKWVYSAHMLNATTGYLVNYTPRPYHTTDGGTTWVRDSIPDAFGGFLYDIKMVNATTGYCVGSSGRVYKTTNGTIWDTLSIPTRSYTNYALDLVNANVVAIIGSTGTGFYTLNGGTSWTYANTNGSTMYNIFMLPDTRMFSVGSSAYIFKTNTVLTGITENESEIPTSYSLDQNYPNPFNPTTTIKFSLPKAGNVTLRIYDVAGREVVELFNNQYMNAGVQKQLFNGSKLASGVYFYSLLVDNNLIDTKKMVLIK